VRPPRTPVARRAIALFAGAPRGDRFHVRARWWTCPIPAVESVVPRAGRILEVGAGHGLLSFYLALTSPERDVVGVDIDEHKIELARAAATRLDPGEASVEFATVTPGAMPEGPFDAIVINDVLYLMSRAQREQVLSDCIERLATGGVLVIKELDVTPRWKYQIGRAQEILATRVLSYTQGDQVEIAPMQEFVDQVEAAGLVTTTTRVDRGYVHPHQLLVARKRVTRSATDSASR
jgi:2-polyprenyl-3-methyl-5-hydroxy-6-metoxy-1,4-benzoquinol methylase